jgi:transcriptional regulator with XRE-family HTH domain
MAAEKFETFEAHLAEMLQDPEFQAAWEASEPAYQIARLRILRGLTQAELAQRVGTKQPSIARLESGRDEPKISFLRRVAEALGARLEVRFVPVDDTQATTPVKTTGAAKAA